MTAVEVVQLVGGGLGAAVAAWTARRVGGSATSSQASLTRLEGKIDAQSEELLRLSRRVYSIEYRAACLTSRRNSDDD